MDIEESEDDTILFDKGIAARLKKEMKVAAEAFDISYANLWHSMLSNRGRKVGVYYNYTPKDLEDFEAEIIPILAKGMEDGMIAKDDKLKCKYKLDCFKII